MITEIILSSIGAVIILARLLATDRARRYASIARHSVSNRMNRTNSEIMNDFDDSLNNLQEQIDNLENNSNIQTSYTYSNSYDNNKNVSD